MGIGKELFKREHERLVHELMDQSGCSFEQAYNDPTIADAALRSSQELAADRHDAARDRTKESGS